MAWKSLLLVLEGERAPCGECCPRLAAITPLFAGLIRTFAPRQSGSRVIPALSVAEQGRRNAALIAKLARASNP